MFAEPKKKIARVHTESRALRWYCKALQKTPLVCDVLSIQTVPTKWAEREKLLSAPLSSLRLHKMVNQNKPLDVSFASVYCQDTSTMTILQVFVLLA